MYIEFQQQLAKLGKTDKERANALGVTTKSIERYRSGRLPSILEKMTKHPELLNALYQDASGEQAQLDAPAKTRV